MGSSLENSPKLGLPFENSDAKYISGLSTILVATIEEAKDRISQIEYIFCSQLFPKFQSNCQGMQTFYSEARKAAEDAFREKEKEFLFQIRKLQGEKQQILEKGNRLLTSEKQYSAAVRECFEKDLDEHRNALTQHSMTIKKLLELKSSLVHSYVKTLEQLEQKITVLLKMERNQETEDYLPVEVINKSKELVDAMELQNELRRINKSEDTLIFGVNVKLKDYEEKVSGLTCKLENVAKNIGELLSTLQEKTEEVEKGKELRGNLFKEIDFQASEIMNNKQMLYKYEKENRILAAKIENLLGNVDALQKDLGQKNNELEESRKAQDKFHQQIDSFNAECKKRAKELEELGKEKKLLKDKHKGLEENFHQLRQSFFEKRKESDMGIELHRDLLQQIEAKDSEIQSEKRKRKEVVDKYKSLKSQYDYLLKKHNHTPETMLHHKRKEDETQANIGRHGPFTAHDIQAEASKDDGISNEVTKTDCNQEILEDHKQFVLAPRSSPVSASTSNILIAAKCTNGVKSTPKVGAKRPSSNWRDTRSHQSRLGPDPHDDFLDTPLENIRGNTGKAMKEENHDFPELHVKNLKSDSFDEETQDMNVDTGARKPQMPPPLPGPSSFKYVEPVRKKSVRENLKGIECKQCKKFYDAVLPEDEKKSDGNAHNMRCEHHDGVSRHRYRFQPPSTPEGFWNIGFESEL